MKAIKNICVYCGSRLGAKAEYAEAARELAKAMVERDIGLVYGGASIGLMGVMADTVTSLGGRAIGVIPQDLLKKEVAHDHLAELHVTKNMHERKLLMAKLSDAFITLPGGIGSMEEMFETWTWAQLGFHQKPCGLLNVAGYFDALAEFIQHSVSEQFLMPQHRDLLYIKSYPSDLFEAFAKGPRQN